MVSPADVAVDVQVGGLPPGGEAWLTLLRDCDGDGWGDPKGTASCVSPVGEPVPLQAGPDRSPAWRDLDLGVVRSLSLTSATFWVQVSLTREGTGPTARLGVGTDPCAPIGCRPGVPDTTPGSGVPAPTASASTAWVWSKEAGSRAIPGAATGVAWKDGSLLLVTSGPGAVSSGVAEAAGLYEVTLEGRRSLVQAATPGTTPLAPFSGRGRVGFVESGPQGSTLVSCKARKCDRVPLSTGLVQVLRVSDKDLVGLSFDLGAPDLVRLDPSTGRTESLGLAPGAWATLLGRPGTTEGVLPYVDRLGADGWDLVLLDAAGAVTPTVLGGPGDQVLPAWRPDGGALAYLAPARTAAKERNP